MSLSVAEKAAQAMEAICRDNSHGYNQLTRLGNGKVCHYHYSDGTEYTMHGGDYDCSSLVSACFHAAGVPVHVWDSTFVMFEDFTNNGFASINPPRSELKRGDVLLNDTHHVALYLGNNLMGEASRSERHSISGREGDQDGLEVRITQYHGGWQHILRYVGDGHVENSTPVPQNHRAVEPGTYRIKVALNVRTSATTESRVVATYSAGDTVILDGWSTEADGFVWGRYLARSGNRRFIALGPVGNPREFAEMA